MIYNFVTRENIITRENYFVIFFICDNNAKRIVTVSGERNKRNLTRTRKFNYICIRNKAVYLCRSRHKKQSSKFMRRVAAPKCCSLNNWCFHMAGFIFRSPEFAACFVFQKVVSSAMVCVPVSCKNSLKFKILAELFKKCLEHIQNIFAINFCTARINKVNFN